MKKDKIKNVLENYRKQAQATQSKIEEAKRIYQGDVAEREISRLKGNLEKEKATAASVIKEITAAGRAEAKAWGEMDGEKITADAKLLENNLLIPEQFPIFVEKYKDNGTMSQLLYNYGEKQNAERRAENPLAPPAFNTALIASAETLVNNVDHIENSAMSILDMVDGGFLGGANSEMVAAAIENFID